MGNRGTKRAMKNTRQALNQVFDQDNACKQIIFCECSSIHYNHILFPWRWMLINSIVLIEKLKRVKNGMLVG